MLGLYRQLLLLYPGAYRREFGAEMLAVFSEMRLENESKTAVQRGAFYVREIAGLIRGAATERLNGFIGPHSDLSVFKGGFMTRNGFRFPKITAVLMTLILAGVLVAIQKGESIAASLPHANPPIGPIQSVHSVLLPPIVGFLLFFYAAGTIGWIILFAMHRSGVHRLDDISGNHR